MKKILFGVLTLFSLSLMADMEESFLQLENEKSFAYIDLELTAQESHLLNQLEVNSNQRLDRFGELDLLEDELYLFLKRTGNQDEDVINAAIDVIVRSAKQVVVASNKTTAWVSVSSFIPTPKFNTPRWHVDGAYYQSESEALYPEIAYKFAATLKGLSTLLYDPTAEERALFNANFKDQAFLSQFFDMDKAESAQVGQGILFIVADPERGAIHSEPKISESRLFFSVVAGSETEIKDLHKRRVTQARLVAQEGEKSWEESHMWEDEDAWRPQPNPCCGHIQTIRSLEAIVNQLIEENKLLKEKIDELLWKK